MTTPYLIAAAALAGFFAGVAVTNLWHDSDDLDALRQQVQATEKENERLGKVAQNLNAELDTLKAQRRKVKIDANPVYDSCIVPDSGMQSLREAINGTSR